MTRALKLTEYARGSVIAFGGVDYLVRNKRVARAMVRDGRPVWSCRPRARGLAILSLSDGVSTHLTDRYMIDMRADAERVPGLSISHTVQTMSRLYMYRLEEWVRACQA